MSFTFGFGGDDIEDADEHTDPAQQVQDCCIDDATPILPQKHSLEKMLRSLPSQISYNVLPISKQKVDAGSGPNVVVVPRRSIFDIRTQLMAEANPEENNNDALLAGLECGDLMSSIYEGGFKTWECSLDLASLLVDLAIDQDFHIVELGAGSAIPSLTVLQKKLIGSCPHSIHFTLCDYNEDVLKLATAPNIFLAEELSMMNGTLGEYQQDLDIEDIDQEKIERCLGQLTARHLSFDFISGAWGEEFLTLVRSPDSESRPMLILASETIYSPKTMRTFADILMGLLRRNSNHNKAWVAAKKVYFGVGGGVDEFVSCITNLHGSVKTLLDVQGAGVGRVILEIVA